VIGSGSILGEVVTCVHKKLEGKLVRREGKDISDMFIQGKSEEKGLWEFHISCSAYRLELCIHYGHSNSLLHFLNCSSSFHFVQKCLMGTVPSSSVILLIVTKI
jgi:hypothetical protein